MAESYLQGGRDHRYNNYLHISNVPILCRNSWIPPRTKISPHNIFGGPLDHHFVLEDSGDPMGADSQMHGCHTTYGESFPYYHGHHAYIWAEVELLVPLISLGAPRLGRGSYTTIPPDYSILRFTVTRLVSVTSFSILLIVLHDQLIAYF